MNRVCVTHLSWLINIWLIKWWLIKWWLINIWLINYWLINYWLINFHLYNKPTDCVSFANGLALDVLYSSLTQSLDDSFLIRLGILVRFWRCDHFDFANGFDTNLKMILLFDFPVCLLSTVLGDYA